MDLFGKPTIEFCEKAGAGIIKRPFYAFSNLAYLIVGVVILGKKTRYSKLFGFMSIAIGLLSLVYDASYVYLSQLLDLLGMMVFVNILIYLSARRYWVVSKTNLIYIQFCAVALGFAFIIYFKSFSGDFVFGAFILIEVILEFLLWRNGQAINMRLWFTALTVFLLAFIIWLVDAKGLWCDTNNFVNGRSVFHILTAAAIYLLYEYFELQKYTDNPRGPGTSHI